MKTYVAGFLFRDIHSSLGCVALIEKQKPEWQRGLLNGIGGKIEACETPHDAMVREFQEETGAFVDDWEQFCELEGIDWKVYFFRSFAPAEIETQEKEKVCWRYVDDLHKLRTLPNLLWLIPLALD